MLRRAFLLAAAAPAGAALAQANLRPDPTPRLPPQPGQGLPLDDRRFLRDAAALSAAQAEAAARAAQAAGDEETRGFATALAARHRDLGGRIAALVQGEGGAGATGLDGEAPGGRVAEALRRLERAAAPGAEPARDFLATQIEVHPVLVELYQTQASHSTSRELGRFAITTLVGVQEDFAAAVRLGARHGLAPPQGLLANPPQYGPGAGPPR
ncbi:DUF4142 domain-containing protein [Falsiroseomonas sp. CW058]|uniref:DUF4142 domain-containing protein n=1 Tax=Falsiroseomonas sp. CW058 TaxID=3388664 RepID=UPI003D31FC43